METFEIVRDIRAWLSGYGIEYKYFESRMQFTYTLSMDCSISVMAFIITVHDEKSFTVHAVCPRRFEEPSLRENVMRYITMANFGLRNGNFELNLNNGEIHYKVYVDCEGLTQLQSITIANAIVTCQRMMERYGNGIAALWTGDSDPYTELKKAEGGM